MVRYVFRRCFSPLRSLLRSRSCGMVLWSGAVRRGHSGNAREKTGVVLARLLEDLLPALFADRDCSSGSDVSRVEV